MAIENVETACAWEQQDWNSHKETEEERNQKRVKMERSKVDTKKRSPDGLTIARANRPSKFTTPRTRGWITSRT